MVRFDAASTGVVLAGFICACCCTGSPTTATRGTKRSKGLPAGLSVTRRGGSQSSGGGVWQPRFPPSEPIPAYPTWSSQSFDNREVLITPRHVSNLKTRDSRVGFIRKVYAILSCQLFITAAVTWYLQTNRHVTRYLLSDAGSWVLGLAGMASFASAAALLFPAVNRRVPLNFALLGLFTGGESVIVGAIAAMYRARSVLLALAQTGVATLGLTLFAFQKNPKYDLTRFGSSLGAALLIFASSLLVSSLFRVPIPEAAVGGIGALLFSVFLIYDTQMIVGGEKHGLQLSDKDYIRGAMEIYLGPALLLLPPDVTRLFIYLLKTFGSRRSSDDD